MSVDRGGLMRGPRQARCWLGGVMLRRLCLTALLVFATGLFAQQSANQSLGDVARKLRTGHGSRKVYTNDDLAGSAKDDADEQPGAAASAKAVSAPAGDAAAKDEAAKKEEDELQKRTDEINKQYTDKIAGIKTQIATTKQDLERLQRDQIESTNQYRSSNQTSPSIYEYQEQQRQIQQQMESDRNQIASLNAQLEDAQEAARHAGVRTGD